MCFPSVPSGNRVFPSPAPPSFPAPPLSSSLLVCGSYCACVWASASDLRILRIRTGPAILSPPPVSNTDESARFAEQRLDVEDRAPSDLYHQRLYPGLQVKPWCT